MEWLGKQNPMHMYPQTHVDSQACAMQIIRHLKDDAKKMILQSI
jgi:hypothetical protein